MPSSQSENVGLIQDPWNPRHVRRLSRAFADLAARELTRDSRGPVRVRDFARRAKTDLLRVNVRSHDPASLLKNVVAAGLHLNHPRYMAQQIAAPIPLAALVESVVAAMNQSIAVWDMSPAGTYVDRDLMSRFKRLFGLPSAAEGSMIPGGSFANLTAFLVARGALVPGSWKRGGSRVAVLVGGQAHYSASRAAAILGWGSDSVFSIPTDSLHRTNPACVPAAVTAARRAGFRKFILMATAGSTTTGSCDDLVELGKLAHHYGAWLHVDAAHGGGLMFSRRHKSKLVGVDRADSVAFDPHKMMFMPLTAGVLLVRDGQHLKRAFEQNAPYLFSLGERECPDIGQFTIACSQRFDALKIWMVWRSYGPALWNALADSVCSTAAAAYRFCVESSVIEPAHAPATNILCCRMRHGFRTPQESDEAHWALKEAVNATGKAYVSSAVLNGRRVLRLVVLNPRSMPSDAVAVLRTVEAQARKLVRGSKGSRK